MSNGDAHKVDAPTLLFEFFLEGLVFLCFSSSSALRLRSEPNPTSMSRRVHAALLNDEGSGLGALGTPLGLIRSGVTPQSLLAEFVDLCC